MGSCASVHKEDVGLPKKLLLASSSPPPSKAAGGGAPVGDVIVDLKRKIEGFGPGASARTDSGSKDEMFFESQPWLDSDCDDDFYSINGDFTPSRGNTPNRTPNRQPKTQQTVMSNVFLPDNAHSPNSSEPSPTGRMKLADLLQEATRNETKEGADAAATGEPDSAKNGQQQGPQTGGKPASESSTGCSTEPTPVREARSRKQTAWFAGRCCLPTFVHSLALEEEGRQKTGPGPCAV